MSKGNRSCKECGCKHLENSRAMDGRRVYRCQNCDHEWSEGMQGKVKNYSRYRKGDQFSDTGEYEELFY